MTRKDYVKIAEVLASALATEEEPEFLDRWLSVVNVAVKMADMLGADNPSFDRGRFLEACGL